MTTANNLLVLYLFGTPAKKIIEASTATPEHLERERELRMIDAERRLRLMVPVR